MVRIDRSGAKEFLPEGSLVQQAQANLDSRIDQLRIIAFGLPGFDEVMNAALESGTPEKK